MLMTIDVGNTHCLFGIFQGETLMASFRINSRTERTADEMAILVHNARAYYGCNYFECRAENYG